MAFRFKIMTEEGPKAWVKSEGFLSIPADEMFTAMYGSYGCRTKKNRHIWDVNEGGEYQYKAVIDDFGSLKQIGIAKNIRG